MVFLELGLSSYAIEDLLLQVALLDEIEASVTKVVAPSNKLFPVLIVGAPPGPDAE
jgi:NAD+ synthase (glutamine-hydrolysing)